jgi:signal transduction histidine kinase
MGQKALAVIRGTPVSRLGIEPSIDDQLIFDAQQLSRWGLREVDLPPGSRVGNHPPSFYRANKALIWTGIAALVVQSGIIGALVVMARARRRAQRAVQAQADALAASHQQLDLAHRSLLREQEGRQVAEEALRQSQKMEALGRLAGGVAHDFNNLLTVIIGQSALLAEQLPAGGALRAGADEIRTASDRAATLTRQLLAFSRKQVVPRTPCRVAATLRQLEPIIRRLVPETVAVELRAADDIPALILGEGQFEQVVLNLVTNAKDAMPDGGRLAIEARVETVASPLLGDPDLQPGTYVVLRVTDSGQGMTAETQRQIFEPFFTTKAAGHGTGVGLATVYGIVKQHGGGITVNSAPGMGATFAVYFPATLGAGAVVGASPLTTA